MAIYGIQMTSKVDGEWTTSTADASSPEKTMSLIKEALDLDDEQMEKWPAPSNDPECPTVVQCINGWVFYGKMPQDRITH